MDQEREQKRSRRSGQERAGKGAEKEQDHKKDVHERELNQEKEQEQEKDQKKSRSMKTSRNTMYSSGSGRADIGAQKNRLLMKRNQFQKCNYNEQSEWVITMNRSANCN